jgi:hypothetical protein
VELRQAQREASAIADGAAREPAAGGAWDTERAAFLAAQAYRYVAKVADPAKLAPLEPLRAAQAAVLEAQEAGDWPEYVVALRRMMRVARKS